MQNNNSTIICYATEDDLGGILEILNYQISNTTNVYDINIKTKEEISLWFNQRKNDDFPVFVAKNDLEIIGYASYGSFRPWQGYSKTIEHSVYVKPNFHGSNVGTLLMNALIKHARNKNFKVMIGGIDAANKKSIAFHEKFGFIEAGTLRKVGYKFEKWLDLSLMQLTLREDE